MKRWSRTRKGSAKRASNCSSRGRRSGRSHSIIVVVVVVVTNRHSGSGRSHTIIVELFCFSNRAIITACTTTLTQQAKQTIARKHIKWYLFTECNLFAIINLSSQKIAAI